MKTLRNSLVVGLVVLVAGCRSAAPEASGIAYELKVLEDPRPNRVHVIKVDLTAGTLRPVVIVGADPDVLLDTYIGLEHAAVAQDGAAVDETIGSDNNVVAKLSVFVDYCTWVYLCHLERSLSLPEILPPLPTASHRRRA